MKLPENLRNDLTQVLWAQADDMDWNSLSSQAKARRYEIWTEDAQIGGRLADYLDPRRVRVYIKDTLMKGYSARSLDDFDKVARILKLPEHIFVSQRYRKPHGVRLEDGRIVCWSKAAEWKKTAIATYERAALNSGGVPYAVVLFGQAPRYSTDPEYKKIVFDVSDRLGISKLVWAQN